MILYHIASRQEAGRTTVDGLRLDPHDWRPVEPPARNFTAPAMPHSLDAVFGDQIQLLGYEIRREGGVLKIDLAWKALRDITGTYKVFAHLFDPATGDSVAQADAQPYQGWRPTTLWWPGDPQVDNLTKISLDGLPPGRYSIALGVYDSATMQRLPATDNQGRALPDDSFVVDRLVEVK